MTEKSRIGAILQGAWPTVMLSLVSMLVALLVGSLLTTWDVASTDLFLRWRLALGEGGVEAVREDVVVVAIDKAALDEYGLWGRGQWLTRKPFAEQLSWLRRRSRPSVVAYDVLFQDTLQRTARKEGRVSGSLERLEAIHRELGDLIGEGGEVVEGSLAITDSFLEDITRLSIEQGEVELQLALTPPAGLQRIPVIMAYNFRGGMADPENSSVAWWSAEDIAGDSKDGDEECGIRIPYLKDVSIPKRCVRFDGARSLRDYVYSHNANLPKLRLLDYVRLGSINVPRDDDGVVRRAPMVIGYEYRNPVTGEVAKNFVPSFSLLACMLHLGIELPISDREPYPVEVVIGNEITLRPPTGRELRIPIDDKGRMYLNFNTRFDDLQAASFVETTGAGSARVAERVRNSIVFVGVSATAIDVGPTPVASQTPLVHIHATAANNILDQTFLSSPGPWARGVVYGLLAVLFTVVCLVEKTVRLAFDSFLAALLYVGAVYLSIHLDWMILPLMRPMLYIGLTSFTVVSYRYFTETRGRRRIRNMFSTMVSSQVLSYLEERPEGFSLEGRKVEATVLFSDIADFTRLSERLPPEKVSEFLNRYLTPVTDCIMNHGGYVDKFMGDLVMGVWGAPLASDGHAEKACMAALAQQQIVRALNEEWKDEYGFVTRTRTGLNSGEMTAGNMGSERKFQYTVVGDAVNFASRLEPLNKDYGTAIIIGDQTRRKIGDRFVTRLLDRTVVWGKTEAIAVHELLGLKTELSADLLDVVRLYERALRCHHARDWKGALSALEEALNRRDDPPSVNLRGRILHYIDNPPGEHWQGEYVRLGKD